MRRRSNRTSAAARSALAVAFMAITTIAFAAAPADAGHGGWSYYDNVWLSQYQYNGYAVTTASQWHDNNYAMLWVNRGTEELAFKRAYCWGGDNSEACKTTQTATASWSSSGPLWRSHGHCGVDFGNPDHHLYVATSGLPDWCNRMNTYMRTIDVNF